MTEGIGRSFDSSRIDALRAGSSPVEPAKPARPLWVTAALTIVVFAAVLYAIEVVDVLTSNSLDDDGIRPRTVDGLWGILWAPMLHYGWGHLIANTIPLLVLGFLTLLSGIARGIAATGIVWLVGGTGTWLTGAPGSVHLGASVLVFGWLTYLLTRGLFTRKVGPILGGVVLLAVYGGLLWSVLPGPAGISWQGHLFGAVGGIMAAWLLSSDERAARRRKPVTTA